MLVAKEASSHLMLRASLQGEHCCCPHSIRQETEAHRSHTSRKQHVFSCIWLFVIPWTVAHQASLSMELSRQEYWSGLPFPPPRYLLDPGIEPASLASYALAGGFFPTVTSGKPLESGRNTQDQVHKPSAPWAPEQAVCSHLPLLVSWDTRKMISPHDPWPYRLSFPAQVCLAFYALLDCTRLVVRVQNESLRPDSAIAYQQGLSEPQFPVAPSQRTMVRTETKSCTWRAHPGTPCSTSAMTLESVGVTAKSTARNR